MLAFHIVVPNRFKQCLLHTHDTHIRQCTGTGLLDLCRMHYTLQTMYVRELIAHNALFYWNYRLVQ